jgi:serine/threonine-protein kinase RsbW
MNRKGNQPHKPHPISKIVRRDNQIEIPSTLDHLPKVVEFVERRLKKLGIKENLVTDIAISVSELVTNAVVHGNKNDLRKKVKTSFRADPTRVEVTVEDEGGGFDRECIHSPIEEHNLLKEAGRGILIVESLMDEVSIMCGASKGTKVRMVKFLTKKKRF